MDLLPGTEVTFPSGSKGKIKAGNPSNDRVPEGHVLVGFPNGSQMWVNPEQFEAKVEAKEADVPKAAKMEEKVEAKAPATKKTTTKKFGRSKKGK